MVVTTRDNCTTVMYDVLCNVQYNARFRASVCVAAAEFFWRARTVEAIKEQTRLMRRSRLAGHDPVGAAPMFPVPTLCSKGCNAMTHLAAAGLLAGARASPRTTCPDQDMSPDPRLGLWEGVMQAGSVHALHWQKGN